MPKPPPRQEQVRYFLAPEEAKNAGFRACRRCLPDRQGTDDELVRLACDYINEYVEANDAPPRLHEISEAVGAVPSHLQREFRRQTGLTPSQYARGRRVERFKGLLREGANVSEAMYEAGYGSSSRLYENAKEQMGMTPASYRKGGAGALVRYIVTESALGGLLLAGTSRGGLRGQAGRRHRRARSRARAGIPGGHASARRTGRRFPGHRRVAELD